MRKKINMAEVLKSLTERNVDDSRPWFLASFLPPPNREVKICWIDGVNTMGSWNGERWQITSPRDYELMNRETLPVGWKPWGGGGMTVGPQKESLPDPLAHGIQIRT